MSAFSSHSDNSVSTWRRPVDCGAVAIAASILEPHILQDLCLDLDMEMLGNRLAHSRTLSPKVPDSKSRPIRQNQELFQRLRNFWVTASFTGG